MRHLIIALSLFAFTFGCKKQNTTNKKEQTQEAAKPKSRAASSKKSSGSCTYLVKKATPSWTAYKYTKKAPVSGTFNIFKLSTAKPGKNLMEALKGLTINIDPKSVESKNAPRNVTIATKFFAIFLKPKAITGEIVAVKGDDKKGTIDIKVGMNGQEKTIQFAYTMEGDTLIAQKSIDMMTFGMKAALGSLHKSCKKLHTGKDGKSKTWTDVLLKVTATITKTCS